MRLPLVAHSLYSWPGEQLKHQVQEVEHLLEKEKRLEKDHVMWVYFIHYKSERLFQFLSVL